MIRQSKLFKQTLSYLLVALMVFSIQIPTYADKIAQTSDIIGYAEYIENHSETNISKQSISFDATTNITSKSGKVESYEPIGNKESISLLTDEDSIVSWEFDVAQSGHYSLCFTYYPIKGNGSPILRDIMIDGAIPYKEAQNVTFDRIWINENSEKNYDISGNQILPAQTESPCWITKFVSDHTGYVSTPLLFFLSKGKHTISLYGVREPMLISSVTFSPEEELKNYTDVIDNYKDNGYSSPKGTKEIILQGEDADRKSDQTVYPTSDRSSPSVSPYSASAILYNTIGGTQWSTVGQWIEWDIDIENDGLYAIGTHYKQALKSGSASIRELYIDGKVPFKEALDLSFPYDSSWQGCLLGNTNGEPYQFYFTKGKHTIRLQVGFGSVSDNIRLAKQYLLSLNAAYRQIVVITGTSPDSYRDYKFEQTIPQTLESLKTISQELKSLSKSIEKQNNGLIQSTATIRRLYQLTDQMLDDPEQISTLLGTWKDNISSFGTWINEQCEQPLILDYITVSPFKTATAPKSEANFFSLVSHYIKQFVYSFISDYSSVGEISQKSKSSIRVWMFSGRDQAQILRRLTTNNFTPNTEISVNLQLVSSGSLLPAILSKSGPDVCLGLTQEEPINLALRNALCDLSSFDDYDSVSTRYVPTLLEPFSFLKGVYALPETQTYPVLFYRTDILKESGISIESLSTWEGVLTDALPKLRRSSLSFGIMPSLNNFAMILYQYGGTLYQNDGKNSGLNEAEAIKAMNDYSTLYTQYGLELSFDFANRFRSGEMPVAIFDFSGYNQLTVFAPEIKGLWNITCVPGTINNSGVINNDSVVTVTGCVILKQSKKKTESWKFLKWWTDDQTQTDYGREIESIVGSAARYNSANKFAFRSVAWDRSVKEKLFEQSEHLKAIPQVPGGYFTTRTYDFAFRDIVYSGEEVRETMLNAADTINKEIKNKRDEYKLD